MDVCTCKEQTLCKCGNLFVVQVTNGENLCASCANEFFKRRYRPSETTSPKVAKDNM